MSWVAWFTQAVWIFFNNPKRNNYFIIQTGNSCNTHRAILNYLHKHIHGLIEVTSVEDCDVILVFCPIVSRAGTDMEAALNKLNTYSASKPAVFMVLHHTFDREKILPDSSRFIKRENTLTVNCLFNEDEMFLKCRMNDEALDKVIKHLKPEGSTTLCKPFKIICGVCVCSLLLYFYCRSKQISKIYSEYRPLQNQF